VKIHHRAIASHPKIQATGLGVEKSLGIPLAFVLNKGRASIGKCCRLSRARE
jgi:hypothetical protein